MPVIHLKSHTPDTLTLMRLFNIGSTKELTNFLRRMILKFNYTTVKRYKNTIIITKQLNSVLSAILLRDMEEK